MKLELVATATFGLEAVVRREIEALGYKIIKTEDGRVTYMGDERAVVRSNLWLRNWRASYRLRERSRWWEARSSPCCTACPPARR